MPSDYEQYYLLEQVLAANARIIPSPDLWNLSDQQVYAALMDRLARPLPNGEASPFSSQAPGSGHAILMATITHYLGLGGHQLNLRSDKDWIETYRMLGVELAPPEYPVINLVFERETTAARGGIPAFVPVATEVQSLRDPNLIAITTEDLTITGADAVGIVPARLNQFGSIPNLRVGEFSSLPRSLSNISSVANDGTVVSSGGDAETLVQAMLRAREGIRTGNLGQYTREGYFDPEANTFLGRCVTPRDFLYYALRLGASKATVLPGTLYELDGYFSDLTTVVVYPTDAATALKTPLNALSLAEQRIDVRGAVIIPIDGIITMRVVPRLNDYEVRQMAASAIAATYDTTQAAAGTNTPQGINPPAGTWGDTNFASSVATVLEDVDGIYAVPNLQLKHAETGVVLEELDIKPWHLLEIQDSIVFNILR